MRKKKIGKISLTECFFLLLMLFSVAPEKEKEKFLQRMKEIEQEPDGNGGD